MRLITRDYGIARLCEVLEKKRSTEKSRRSSYFTVSLLNAQPYPKVKAQRLRLKVRNAAQDFCDGWALTTLLLNPVQLKRGVGA